MLSLLKKLFWLALIIVIGTFITDYVLVMRMNKESIFTFKENDDTKYGLFYKIRTVENINEFYIFNFKLDEIEVMEEVKEFELIDKTNAICKEVKTYFYEDDNNKYYFDCMKQYYIKINKIEYSLKNALENNLITIDDLDDKGLEYKVESK